MAAGDDINLKLSATDAGLENAVRSADAALQRLDSRVSPLAASFDKLNAYTKRLRDRQAELAPAVAASTRALQQQGIGMGGLRNAMGQFISAAVAARFAMQAFREAGEIGDLAEKLNETAGAIQRVQAAALPSGVSVETMGNSMQILARSLGDVENKKAARALKEFGVTAERLTTLPMDRKLLLLSDAFQKARETGRGLNDIMALLGRGGKELTGVLGQGSAAIKELYGSVKVVSDEDITRLDAMNDRFDALTLSAKRYVQEGILDVVDGLKLLSVAASMITPGTLNFSIMMAGGSPLDDAMEAIEKRKRDAGDKAAKAQIAQATTRKNAAGALAKETAENAAEEERKATEKAEADKEKRGERTSSLQLEILSPKERITELEKEKKQMTTGAGVTGTVQGALDAAANAKRYGNVEEEERLLVIAEKLRKLEEEITQAKEDQAKIDEEKADALGKAKKDVEDADETVKTAGEKLNEKQGSSIVADSLTAIGGGGGGFAPGLSDSQKQVSVAEEQRDLLQKIYEKLGSGEGTSITTTE